MSIGNGLVTMELFTIGHSNHAIEFFIELLKMHEVTAIADVRSHPYSRYLPHFNQAALKVALESEKIRYVFLGAELGARPDIPECYVDGKALYAKIAATDQFFEGIKRLLKGVKTHRVALMCAEKDPLTCHRAILICQHLREYNLNIKHILKNGDLESHQELEERMLAKNGFTSLIENSGQSELSQLSLFETSLSYEQDKNQLSKDECLEQAYQLQGDAIAYVEKGASVYA